MCCLDDFTMVVIRLYSQDQTCFCVGTETGFRIHNSDPLRVQVSQDWGPGGGVRHAEMLFRWVRR